MSKLLPNQEPGFISFINMLRLPFVFMGVGIAYLGMEIIAQTRTLENLVIYLFVTVTAVAIMIHNDVDERHHDAEFKGKLFALRHEDWLKSIELMLWTASILLGLRILFSNQVQGAMAGAIVLMGYFYTKTFRVPGLPTATVATSAALMAGMGLAEQFSWQGVLLVTTTWLFIFAHEICTDFADLPSDMGYKYTLPVTLGWNVAKNIAMWLCVVTAFLAMNLHVEGLSYNGFLSGVLIMIGSSFLYQEKDKLEGIRWARKFASVGFALLLITNILGV